MSHLKRKKKLTNVYIAHEAANCLNPPTSNFARDRTYLTNRQQIINLTFTNRASYI